MTTTRTSTTLLLSTLAALAACADRPATAPAGDRPVPRVAAGLARPDIFAPGAISDPAMEEWRLTFTPDGDTAYFGRSAEFFPIARQATIMRVHRVGGGWSTPEVADFSGEHPDLDPFITSDGTRLYFSSIRPVDGVPRADADVWMVERTADGTWGTPVNLGPAVNSLFDELYPSVADDGTLYVGSDRPGGHGGWDIYRARVVGGVPQPLENLGPAVNTALWEFNPVISPDGRRLVFTGLNHPGGHGLGDLYVTWLHRGDFQPAVNLGPEVNTALDEYHASFSPDGKWLYFLRHSYEPWVPGDFYTIRVSALGEMLQPGAVLR